MLNHERGRNTRLTPAFFTSVTASTLLMPHNEDKESSQWYRVEWWTSFPPDARWAPTIKILHGTGNAAIPIEADIAAGNVTILVPPDSRFSVVVQAPDIVAPGTGDSVVNVIVSPVTSFTPSRMTRSFAFLAVAGAGGVSAPVTPKPNGADTAQISTIGIGAARNVTLDEYSDGLGTVPIAHTVVAPSQVVQLTGRTKAVTVTNNAGAPTDVILTFTLGDF